MKELQELIKVLKTHQDIAVDQMQEVEETNEKLYIYFDAREGTLQDVINWTESLIEKTKLNERQL